MKLPGGAALPDALAAAVEERLARCSPADLAAAAAALSSRYRDRTNTDAPPPATRTTPPRTAAGRSGRSGRGGRGGQVGGVPPAVQEADAYLAVRLPATFAAVDRVLAEAEARLPDLTPGTVADLGAGPGTAAWAAAERWPTIHRIELVEASASFGDIGRALARTDGAPAPLGHARWHRADAVSAAIPSSELTIMAYLLSELDVSGQRALVDRAWKATEGALVIVEPGTPATSAGVGAARRQLIAAGATIVAPCPHDARCPYEEADDRPVAGAPGWCHFSVRLPRSRRHRAAKGADAGFEDERFSYLVAVRPDALSGDRPAGRVLGPPRRRGASIVVPLCDADGVDLLEVRPDDRRALAAARRRRWGDAWT